MPSMMKSTGALLLCYLRTCLKLYECGLFLISLLDLFLNVFVWLRVHASKCTWNVPRTVLPSRRDEVKHGSFNSPFLDGGTIPGKVCLDAQMELTSASRHQLCITAKPIHKYYKFNGSLPSLSV